MLGSFTPSEGRAKASAKTPSDAPPSSGGSLNLEQSLERQEKQTVAIENMMGELQTLMLSKVEEEKRINADLREDMDELRAQIGLVKDSYSDACDQLEMTSLELDSRTARVAADLTQMRDGAEQRAVDAAKRQKELESEVEKVEAERNRIFDQREVIVSHIKDLGDIVVQRRHERDEMEEARAQAEAQKAEPD